MATYPSSPSSYQRLQTDQSLTSRCKHKDSILCLELSPRCCSCSDLAIPTESLPSKPERWSNYCVPCQSFWKRQAQETKTSSPPPHTPTTTGIPPPNGPVGANYFARLNAPFTTVPYIPPPQNRYSPVIVSSPTQPLNLLFPSQSSPLRKKKRGGGRNNNNKKPGKNIAEVEKDLDQSGEGPSNTQNENLRTDPPAVAVPAYVCPAARVKAERALRESASVSAQPEEPVRTWTLANPYGYGVPGGSEGSTSSLQRHTSLSISKESSKGYQAYSPRTTGGSPQTTRSSSGIYQAYRPPITSSRSVSASYQPYRPDPLVAHSSTENHGVLTSPTMPSGWRPGDWSGLRLESNTVANRDTSSTKNAPTDTPSTQQGRYRSRTWEGITVSDPPEGSWSSDIAGEWQPPMWIGRGTTDTPIEQSPISEDSRFPGSGSPSPRQSARGKPQGPVIANGSSVVQPVDVATRSYPRPSLNESDPSRDPPGVPRWLEYWTETFNSPQGVSATRNLSVTESSAPPTISWAAPSVQPLPNDLELQRHTIDNPQSGGDNQDSLSVRRKQFVPTPRAPLSAGLIQPDGFRHIQDANNQIQVHQRTNNTAPIQSQLPQRSPHRRNINSPAALPAIQTDIPISAPQAQRTANLPAILSPTFHESESDNDSVWSNLAPSRRRARLSGPTIQPAVPAESPRLHARPSTPPLQPPRLPPLPPVVLDEWETWDPDTWAAATLESTPEQVDLAQIAEDASVLLELFSKTKPRNNVDIGDEHKEMIENAFKSIVKIRKEFRLIAAQKNENIESLALPEEGEGVAAVMDSECIICYNHIADTVVLPCKHLVLCMACCDKIGIREKAQMTHEIVQCPICRTRVQDRLKIFRG